MKLEMIQSPEQTYPAVKKEGLLFVPDDGTENEVINLYPSVTGQTMEGFGGAITDAAGYVFSKMTAGQQDRLLETYFGKEGLGYNRVRLHMDSCDFSTCVYSAVEDEKDEELDTFCFAYTEKYMMPLLEACEKKAGKKLKLMLSAWSPPAFMKTNNSRIGGGSLKREYYGRWAAYLCRYIQEFRKRGYEVERISIQNEPAAVQTWDSCVYTPEQEKEFLKDYLYPEMKRRGLEHVEIFGWDHNKERLFERANQLLDMQTGSMIAGFAFHWYSGDHFEALDLVRQQYPERKLILSESCLEFGKYDKKLEAENAARLAHDMIGNLNHGMQAFYDWNLLLDQDGGPNHQQNYCDAPWMYHEEEGRLEERRILRYYWHFAHFIKPGAVRIAHTKYTDWLDVTAWKNPEGELICICMNKSEKCLPAVLRISGMMCPVKLEPRSIASCVIKGTEQKTTIETTTRKEQTHD